MPSRRNQSPTARRRGPGTQWSWPGSVQAAAPSSIRRYAPERCVSRGSMATDYRRDSMRRLLIALVLSLLGTALLAAPAHAGTLTPVVPPTISGTPEYAATLTVE